MSGTDIIDIQEKLDSGSYKLKEEENCVENKKKLWARFWRVVHTEGGGNVYRNSSPHGYAVCRVRECKQICRLGLRGGTTELENHFCPPVVVDYRLIDKKITKNTNEKQRKEEISAVIKDCAALVMGKEVSLTELTRVRLTRAALTEIPSTIIQFCNDGKSPQERPLSFYDEAEFELRKLLDRILLAKTEACSIQGTNHSTSVQNSSDVTPPNIHLGLSYKAGDENIDITWVPTDVISLGFDREKIIGKNLEELVHPEDYPELVRSLQQSEYHLKDLTFPECRVALEPLRPRNKTAALEYRAIFLTGHIRQTIRTARQKSSISDKQIMPLGHTSWPRLATFLHITHYHYMTLHSIDGRIIQADKRITTITGYACDEVVNKIAHDFIDGAVTPVVKKAHDNWVTRNGSNFVSFPLIAKNKEILYLKSRGEFIYYRDPVTNTLVQGIVCNNSLINEDEYLSEHETETISIQRNSTLTQEEYFGEQATSTITQTSLLDSSGYSSVDENYLHSSTPLPMEWYNSYNEGTNNLCPTNTPQFNKDEDLTWGQDQYWVNVSASENSIENFPL